MSKGLFPYKLNFLEVEVENILAQNKHKKMLKTYEALGLSAGLLASSLSFCSSSL
jgi:hypothetical protein